MHPQGALESTRKILTRQEAWGEFRDPSKRGNMMNLSPPRGRFCSAPEAGKK